MHKCKMWFSGWDVVPDNQLSCEARYLLQKVARDVGGLAPMGGAAKKDWSAAVGKTWHTTSHACQTPDQRPISPCIPSLPLQAEGGKDRHKAWLMLTMAAMWEQRDGRVEVRRDAMEDLQTSGIIRNKVTMNLLGLWQVVR